MIFRAANYEDNQHDSCGNTTMSVIEIGGISICLCEECTQSLIEQIEEFKNTIFCYKCDHYLPNKYGRNYSGSCKKWAEKDGVEIKESSIGYSYCRDYMYTCKDAELKRG